VSAEGVLTDAQAYTAVYFVTHDDRGHHFEFLRAGSAASRMTPGQLPRALIAEARLLHLSGVSLAISTSACDTAHAAIDIAREAGALVCFDTNLRLKLWTVERARAVMDEVMQRCDLCLPSYDDVVALTGLTEPDALVDHCLRLGARIVALKLGHRGAVVADAQRRVALPPHPCQPVDATGAGDTFGGAFAARLLAGDDMVEAARYAGVAAALSTQGYGAVDPIPQAAQVHAALADLPEGTPAER
jgi:2-dehydro-3-deoxygluconokinase